MALLVFAIAALVEAYLFALQRAALEVGRRQGLDPVVGRYMLPLWYSAVWPVKLAKWGAVWFVYRSLGFMPALALLGASSALTMLIPVPKRHGRALFERRVQELYTERPEIAAKLTLALMRDDAPSST